MIVTLMNILSILLMLCIIPTAWLVYKKKLTFFNGVFLGTFLFLMSFGCSVYGTYIINGQSPLDLMINSIFDNLQRTYSSTPGMPAENLELLNKMTAELKVTYSILLPSLIVLSNLLWAYIILMVLKGILALLRKDVSNFAKFSELKMPKMAILLAVISHVLSILFKEQQTGYAFLNFAEIIFMVSSVCGLSVIDYAFRKKLRFSLIRALIYIPAFLVITVVMGMGGSALVFVGVLDAVFDFRKLNGKVEQNQ